MDEHAATPSRDHLRTSLARGLYDFDQSESTGQPSWDDASLDIAHPGLRDRYLRRADALVAGPLARLVSAVTDRSDLEEELHVLRRQRMAPDRERELLEANNRMLHRAESAEAELTKAADALAAARRDRDVAREAEAFWQHFAFDSDELATRRLVEHTEARAAAERQAIRERCRRERAESALRLFADRADVMPKEGWASELVHANRDIPLWWFHAARVALDAFEPDEGREGGPA